MSIGTDTSFNKLYLRRLSEDDSLLSVQLRRKIFLNVVAFHIIFILIPAAIFYIDKILPRKKIIQVKLVSLSPPAPLQPEIRMPEQPKTPPEKPMEAPPPPELPKEIKEPVPPKEPAMIKEPKVTIEEPKIKPDVKVKDKQKTQKKPPEKEKTADVKEEPKNEPKKTLLDPSEINISKSVVKGKAPQKPIPVVSASDIASSLRKIQEQCAVSGDSTTLPIDYYDTVSSYLYRLWKQPSKAELKGLRPSVTITMSVSGNGTVRSARISSKSGNQPMDRSVSELLARLKIIPAPPDGKEIEISVNLVIVD